MTQIHDITITVPNRMGWDNYNVEMVGLVTTETVFDQLRELFSLCESTGVQFVPGRRPIGWDATEDEVNVRYCTFTHGDKPENGWYLLRSFNTFEDESAQGHSQYFILNMVFLGTSEYLVDGYRLKSLESLTNDWGI